MTKKTSTRYSPEVRERSVRMVFEHQHEACLAMGGDRIDRGDERLTGALLDRLTHHVHILEMNGPSYRLAQSRARRSASKP